MPDLLSEIAENFKRATKYNYYILTGRKGEKFDIDLRCLKKEFTHIVGLDHLTDIKEFSTSDDEISKTKQKISAFQSILSGELTFSDLSASSKFEIPFPKTYNPKTQSQYTLTQRIAALKNIELLLDSVHTGKLYRWKRTKSNITLKNGKKRQCSIDADYMLAIPSANVGEKVYLFMYKDRTPQKGDQPVKLYVYSAFPEGYDLSEGQESPFTILEVVKSNVKGKERKVLFTHPSLKKEREQAQNENITSNTIKVHQNSSPSPYIIRTTDQEIAALEQAGITIQRCKKGKESDGKTAIRFDEAHKEQAKMILDGLRVAKQKR